MARFLRHYGYDYRMSVYSFLKVAMDKNTNKEEIEEEAFDAVKNLYNHESHIKVIDIETIKIEQGEYFTFADVRIDLRVDVTCHGYEKAYEDAEAETQLFDLPAGVAYIESQTYDCECTGEMVVGE